MLHIPLLRRGQPYRSLDVVRIPHHGTGQAYVEVSQANSGLIRRDLRNQRSAREALDCLSAAQLLTICREAADRFVGGTLSVGEVPQTADDYVEQVSATTGLSHVLVRRNMEKIRGVLAEMKQVLDGLTRNLDLQVLDDGFGDLAGHAVSFVRRGDSLGVVLPSNSPGVHSLWIPSVALKTPLVLKPGSAEPWTPLRVAHALIASGCPAEAFSYYPTDHAGAADILRRTGRAMLFGDGPSVAPYRGDSRIELHGPGFSKLVIGADEVDRFEEHLDTIVRSVADNGGRSCVNASGIWVPSRGDEIAEALAARLSSIVPRDVADPEASLAPFAVPDVARRISQAIDADLNGGGGVDVSATRRGPERIAMHDGSTYLLPTVVRCPAEHPLANREFLFPYASVVEVDEAAIPEVLGSSLVVTAITHDESLRRRLIGSPLIDRLNLGAIPTNQISWDQPHEGNLFDHLYARRAFQRSA